MENGIEVEALLTGENLTHLLSLSVLRKGQEQISKIEKAFIKKFEGNDETVGPLDLRFVQGEDSTNKMLVDGFTGLQIDLETLNVIYPSEWKGWVVSLRGVVLH